MELGTFGAIMGFALACERHAAAFYAQAQDSALAELFEELATSSRKRIERVERARREGVSEMVLEPIVGLDGDDYQIDLKPKANTVSRLQQALSLEEACARFYRDAASKMPIREVARLFRRLAQESEHRLALLLSETEDPRRGQ
jgi:rubrerythrin